MLDGALLAVGELHPRLALALADAGPLAAPAARAGAGALAALRARAHAGVLAAVGTGAAAGQLSALRADLLDALAGVLATQLAVLGLERLPVPPRIVEAVVRLWKLELQRLADETGLATCVCHFPPGTSKWKRVEQRLFSFIGMNWRGRPLISHEVMIDLIASTRTRSGLQVHAELDAASYPKGLKVAAAPLAAIDLSRDPFHGEWNYTIHPRPPDP